jgi:hypothetical protein
MTDRRLGESDRSREIAHTSLAVGVRADQAQEAEPGWIGEDLQGSGEPLGLVLAQRGGEDLRAALRVDDRDLTHAVILTNVDGSVNVSTIIDGREEETAMHDGGCCPPGCC